MIIGLVSFPAVSHATTAEETFAYIAFNLESGTTRQLGNNTLNVVAFETNPLTFNISDGKEEFKISIQQGQQCQFDVELIGLDPEGSMKLSVNMGNFIGIDWSAEVPGAKGALQFSRDCSVTGYSYDSKKMECVPKPLPVGFMFNSSVDKERVLRAIQYFKENYCAGSPY
jgi:hypothetical protein